MAVIITSEKRIEINDKGFAINTLNYRVVNNSLEITHLGMSVVPPTLFSEYTFNGATPSSINDLKDLVDTNFFAEPPEGGVPIDATITIDGQTKELKDSPSFTIDSSNLLYTYTHSGNKEVNITAIDVATDVFTAIAHGFTTGNRVGIAIKNPSESGAYFNDYIPFSQAGNSVYFVEVLTTNTFKLKQQDNVTYVDIESKGTTDLSKWHLEMEHDNLVLSGIDGITTGCKIEIIGQRLTSSALYIDYEGVITNSTIAINGSEFTTNNSTRSHSSLPMNVGIIRATVDMSLMPNGGCIKKLEVFLVARSSVAGNIVAKNSFISQLRGGDTLIKNGLSFNAFNVSNGTIVRIYKK